MNEVETLKSELKNAQEANRKLHRRLQKAEAPAMSYDHRLEYVKRCYMNMWLHEFNRMCAAHNDVKDIFLQLARVFEYPQNGEHIHSVMDSKLDTDKKGFIHTDGVYANCFVTRQGGVRSFLVKEEVEKMVNELIELRKEKNHE